MLTSWHWDCRYEDLFFVDIQCCCNELIFRYYNMSCAVRCSTVPDRLKISSSLKAQALYVQAAPDATPFRRFMIYMNNSL